MSLSASRAGHTHARRHESRRPPRRSCFHRRADEAAMSSQQRLLEAVSTRIASPWRPCLCQSRRRTFLYSCFQHHRNMNRHGRHRLSGLPQAACFHRCARPAMSGPPSQSFSSEVSLLETQASRHPLHVQCERNTSPPSSALSAERRDRRNVAFSSTAHGWPHRRSQALRRLPAACSFS